MQRLAWGLLWPSPVHDGAFETLLGSMVGRLVDAAPDGVEPALARALAELCSGFDLRGAGLLQPGTEASRFELTVEACIEQPVRLRDLVTSWPESELTHVLKLLRRNSPFLIEPSAGDARFARICERLSMHSLGPASFSRLELAGAPLGALVLVAREGVAFSPRLLLRMGLVADTLAIAHVLRDRRHRAGELTDDEMRAFERKNLLAVIERCGWRLQGERGAARALGLSPSTLRDRLRSFGIQRPR